MKVGPYVLICILIFCGIVCPQKPKMSELKAIYLSNITWQQAEKILTPDTIVVIPMGAQSKAHGPHLPLSTDFVQVEYLKERVAERFNVVIAPTVSYGYYPPFIEFPGSTTIGISNAKGMISDICRSLARFGVRRFYVINQGLSTNAALEPAAAELGEDGIILKFTNLVEKNELLKTVIKQEKGSHADEIETSIMLYIAEKLVDRAKADKDYGTQKGSGYWPTRNPNPDSEVYTIYNPSGTYGDATIATKEKGKFFVETLLASIGKDIEVLKTAELPKIAPASARYAKFTGKYEFAPGDTVSVGLDRELIAVERAGRPKLRLMKAGANRFEIARTEVTFLSDTKGAITHLLFTVGGQSVLARKIE